MLITSLDKYLTNKKGVIHVGGHDGEERDWYISNGFEPVIWFEPNFELFDRLTKNIENYNMLAFNFGIHDTLKQAPLFISSNDGQSSSILELGTHAKYYPDVRRRFRASNYQSTTRVKPFICTMPMRLD